MPEEGCWSSSTEGTNVFSEWQMVRWAEKKIRSSELNEHSPPFFALKNKCMWRNVSQLEGCNTVCGICVFDFTRHEQQLTKYLDRVRRVTLNMISFGHRHNNLFKANTPVGTGFSQYSVKMITFGQYVTHKHAWCLKGFSEASFELAVHINRAQTSNLVPTSLFKSFWLPLMLGFSEHANIIAGCHRREKSSSTKCSVMDDTCRHEVLSLVWERRMTNHGDSVGEIWVRMSVREWVYLLIVTSACISSVASLSNTQMKEN